MVEEQMLTIPARLQLTEVRHFLSFDVATKHRALGMGEGACLLGLFHRCWQFVAW